MARSKSRKRRIEKIYQKVATLFLGTAIAYTGASFACGLLYENLPETHPGKIMVEGILHNAYLNDKLSKRARREPEAEEKNRYGHRTQREYNIERPENQYRILFLGGSTTYGHKVKIGETYPDEVQRRLSEKFPTEDILVINAGRNGMNSEEMKYYYPTHEKRFGANLTVIHTGANDGYQRAFNMEGATLAMRIEMEPQPWTEFFFSNSFTGPITRYVGASVYALNSEARRRAVEIVESLKDKKRFEDRIEKVSRYPKIFHDRIREVVEEVKLTGSEVILFPVPIVAENKWAGEEASRIIKMSMTRNSEALEDISEECETGFIEAPNIPKIYFVDECHLDKDGEILKGDIVADFIIDSGYIQRWIQEREEKSQETENKNP